MKTQYIIGKGYNNANSTKEALTGQPEIRMLNAANERGIYRASKHDNRNRKRQQHLSNLANRANPLPVKGK